MKFWAATFRVALVATLLGACGTGHETTPAEGPTAEVTQAEVLTLVGSADGPLLLDVRTPQEFASGHVPGARNIPFDQVTAHLADLQAFRQRGAVVYCESGGRAAKAIQVLRGAGFQGVRHLQGDMSGWRSSGRAVER